MVTQKQETHSETRKTRKNKVEEEFKPFSFAYVGAKQEVP